MANAGDRLPEGGDRLVRLGAGVEERRVPLELGQLQRLRSVEHRLEPRGDRLLRVREGEPVLLHEPGVAADVGDEQQGALDGHGPRLFHEVWQLLDRASHRLEAGRALLGATARFPARLGKEDYTAPPTAKRLTDRPTPI